MLDLLVEASTYEVSGLDPVAYVDAAASYDRDDGKISLFILNRDLAKSRDVEVVWKMRLQAASCRQIY